MLTSYDWEEINTHKEILILKQDRQYRLARAITVGLSANQQAMELSDLYQEIKPWSNDLLWVKSDSGQAVLDQAMHEHIKFDQHTLKQTSFGAIGTSTSGSV